MPNSPILSDRAASAKNESPPAAETRGISEKGAQFRAEWLSVVEESARHLRFGVVMVTVHDGKVVQVERTERTRFEIAADQPRRQAANGRG